MINSEGFSPPTAIAVWPTALVPGWDGGSALSQRFPVVGLVDALETHWTSDAHGSGVLVPKAPDDLPDDRFGPWEPAIPRLRKTAPAVLAEAGQMPALSVVFVDFDRMPHEPWPDGPAGEGATRAVRVAGAMCPEASSYATLGGLRLVWCLERAIPASFAKSWLDAWLLELERQQIPRALGLGLDHTSVQWTRCFRLPRVIRDGKRLDPTMDLTPARAGIRLVWQPPADALRAAPLAKAAVVHLDGGACEPPGLDELPVIDEIDWSILLNGTGYGTTVAPLVRPLRAGLPYSAPGARDTTLVRGLGATTRALLKRVAPPAPPNDSAERTRATLDLAERAWAVWHRSIDATIAVDPSEAPSVDKAWRLVVEFAARDVAEAADHLATVAATSVASSTDSRGVAAPFDDPAPSEEDPPLPGDDDSEGPTVLVLGSRYRVRGPEGHYGSSVTQVGLAAECRRQSPEINVVTPRGQPRTAAWIVTHHGATVSELVSRYALPHSHSSTASTARTEFDPVSGLLRCDVAPLRPVVPRFDPEVAAWLEALCGGDHAEILGTPGNTDGAIRWSSVGVGTLLDWLATVADLDQATAAIYLRGGADAGKTLFARGVAALWSDAAVDFDKAISRFNADLLRCPIVHLSEGPRDPWKSGLSFAFRALVGDRTHPVEAKYEPSGMLIGHPRVIVGANNDSALPMTGHHTRDDLDAIARRVLYICADTDAAASVLRAVPQRRLATWTDPGGAIPAHIAYLRETRSERVHASAGRFLVEGVVDEQSNLWQRELIIGSGRNESVLAAIAEAVAPRGSRVPSAAVVIEPSDDGVAEKARVWVNIAKLHAGWRGLVDEDVPRNERSILAKTIRDLSPSKASTVKRTGESVARYWDIPAHLVLSVAEAHGVSSLDALVRTLQSGAPGPLRVVPGGASGAGQGEATAGPVGAAGGPGG